MIDSSGKQVAIVIAIFVLLNAVLICWAEFLPFIDLPNHLAEATIFKLHEPGSHLSMYYQPTPWYFPNTFHTVFCSAFPSVEWGNRIFHLLYIVLLQGSVYLLIKELGGNPWYGLLAILFTYNYNVTFGFVGFAISIPTIILLFYTTLLYFRTGRTYLSIVISLILVLLFYMHAQNALFGLIVYGLMILYHFRTSIIRVVIHCVTVPAPLLILILAWWFSRTPLQEEVSTFEYLKDYYSSTYFQKFPLRFGIAVFDNFQLQAGWAGIVIALFFFLCVLLPLVILKSWKKLPLVLQSGNFFYAAILFAVSAICYLFAPDSMPGQTPIFQRFCTIVMLSFIILASLLFKDSLKRRLKYFVLVVIALYTGLWSEYVVTFNRVNMDFSAGLFDGLKREQPMAGLIYDNSFRGRKVYIHFPNYYLVWKGGVAASKIIDYRFGVVRRAKVSLPYYNELIGDYYTTQPAYADISYLLVRGTAPVRPDQNLDGFKLIKKSGPWRIFENTRHTLGQGISFYQTE